MRMMNVVRLSALLCVALILGACGSGGSDTNGVLALSVPTPTALSGGFYSVSATATYSNPNPINTSSNTGTTSLIGVPITISVTVRGAASGTIINTFSKGLSTDSAGQVTTGPIHIPQTNEVLIVDVTAVTGGLRQSATVSIPSL